jgi:tetratricopeptide (TPR) repeat protein
LQTEIDMRSKVEPEVLMARYRDVLKRDPSLDQARLGLADLLRINHRNAEAAFEYAAYMARKPNDPMGYLGAGRNALDMDNELEAIRWLDRTVTLAPGDSVALAARAAVEIRRGRFQAALGYLDRAVQAFRFDPAIHYQRMLVLNWLGKRAEADAERKTVEQLRQDQADFARISGDLRRSPQDPRLRSAAAQWLMAHGHQDEAVEWANLVLTTDPSHTAMNRLLSGYYRQKGQAGLANFHESLASRTSN